MSGGSVLRPFFFDVLHVDGRSLIDEPLQVRKSVLAQAVPSHLRLPTLDTSDAGEAERFAAAAVAAGHEGVMVKSLDSPYQAGRRGVDLIDAPLTQRLDALRRSAAGWVVEGAQATSAHEIADVNEGALAAGQEGIVVKDPTSAYAAGRRGSAWRKVKPVHTLDLVVLAAEWGHGRRTGRLSNLHLGARGDEGSFVMVGKTFKGLTDELLRWQTEALLARAIGAPEAGYIQHVRPELVVEIAIDGVQRSVRYPGGVALRFARVRGYRPDKSAAEADTIEMVRSLL